MKLAGRGSCQHQPRESSEDALPVGTNDLSGTSGRPRVGLHLCAGRHIGRSFTTCWLIKLRQRTGALKRGSDTRCANSQGLGKGSRVDAVGKEAPNLRSGEESILELLVRVEHPESTTAPASHERQPRSPRWQFKRGDVLARSVTREADQSHPRFVHASTVQAWS